MQVFTLKLDEYCPQPHAAMFLPKFEPKLSLVRQQKARLKLLMHFIMIEGRGENWRAGKLHYSWARCCGRCRKHPCSSVLSSVQLCAQPHAQLRAPNARAAEQSPRRPNLLGSACGGRFPSCLLSQASSNLLRSLLCYIEMMASQADLLYFILFLQWRVVA